MNITSDAIFEEDEVFQIILTQPSTPVDGPLTIDPDRTSITITDDDGELTYIAFTEAFHQRVLPFSRSGSGVHRDYIHNQRVSWNTAGDSINTEW